MVAGPDSAGRLLVGIAFAMIGELGRAQTELIAAPALLAGESVDEIASLLGHRDATVTRVVYVHEIADTRRRQMRRSRMTAEYAGALRVALDSDGERDPR